MSDKWFEYSTYMANKLAQVQASDPDGNWNADSLALAFEQAGYKGVDGAQQHFKDYGSSRDENLSPNQYFNVEQYCAFKAKQIFELDTVKDVTQEQISYIKAAIYDAGMSAWTHYTSYGTAEGINPSNNFDTNKYLTAKLAALQAADPDTYADWTTEDVANAFAEAGMNALEHAMVYSGAGEGETEAAFVDGKVADAFAVDDTAETGGDNQYFTTALETLTGTSGDDTFTGAFDTMQAGDTVNGGDGNDTVIWADTNMITEENLPTMNSVEALKLTKMNINASGELDVSSISGLNSVEIADGKISVAKQFTLTTTDSQKVVVTNVKATNDGGIAVKGATSVAVDGVTADTGKAFTVDVAGSQTTFAVTGQNNDSTFTLANAGEKLETLTLAGDKALEVTTDVATLTAVDASTASGDITTNLTTTAASIAAAFAYAGGSGKDVLKLASGVLAALDDASSLDGGSGSEDELWVADAAPDATLLGKVKNFEGVGFNGTASVSVADAAALSGFDSVVVATTGHNFTVTSNADKVATYTLDTTGGALGDFSATAAKLNSKVTLNVQGGTAASDAGDVTLASYTDITFAISEAAVKVGSVTADENAKIAVSGDQDFTLTLGDVKMSLDATGFTGKLDVTMGKAAQAVTGGEGVDTITMTGFSAAAATTIEIDGGAGADLIQLAAGTSATARNQTVSLAYKAGEDKIGLGLDPTTGTALEKITNLGSKADVDTALASATSANTLYSFVVGSDVYAWWAISATVSADADGILIKLEGVTSESGITVGDFYA